MAYYSVRYVIILFVLGVGAPFESWSIYDKSSPKVKKEALSGSKTNIFFFTPNIINGYHKNNTY